MRSVSDWRGSFEGLASATKLLPEPEAKGHRALPLLLLAYPHVHPGEYATNRRSAARQVETLPANGIVLALFGADATGLSHKAKEGRGGLCHVGVIYYE